VSRSDEGQTDPWAVPDAPVLTPLRKLVRASMSRERKLRLYVRMLETPVLSELYVRSRGRLRRRRIGPNTRLVLEAFPSSGNTFCRQAMLLTNPDIHPDDICSHTHSSRVVQRAVRAGIPCIVVARDPRDAVSSAVQRFKGMTASSATWYYERYYGRLLPLRDSIVVAPFSAVITDFVAVIEQCNQKYGTQFATGRRISTEEVFASIDERTRRKQHGRIPELTVSRPSSGRKPAAEFLASLDGVQREAMDRALEVYERFVAGAPPGS